MHDELDIQMMCLDAITESEVNLINIQMSIKEDIKEKISININKIVEKIKEVLKKFISFFMNLYNKIYRATEVHKKFIRQNKDQILKFEKGTSEIKISIASAKPEYIESYLKESEDVLKKCEKMIYFKFNSKEEMAKAFSDITYKMKNSAVGKLITELNTSKVPINVTKDHVIKAVNFIDKEFQNNEKDLLRYKERANEISSKIIARVIRETNTRAAHVYSLMAFHSYIINFMSKAVSDMVKLNNVMLMDALRICKTQL
ncbi:hypothetical protein Bp8pS_273 [Bacillus phage vB_BpuM-BpSp]|nr:hypothetical protein Bp8pS_273 [Bacillus phage vB_BpuM-BpSp]